MGARRDQEAGGLSRAVHKVQHTATFAALHALGRRRWIEQAVLQKIMTSYMMHLVTAFVEPWAEVKGQPIIVIVPLLTADRGQQVEQLLVMEKLQGM